ncbi:hypothetical protein V5799_020614 [Amblyomma americanum]|uniref:Methyltransferase n=1 Tax=Amblyomma americanum TaxID=6943 RepID=A0AAQ4ETL3_AMBAM
MHREAKFTISGLTRSTTMQKWVNVVCAHAVLAFNGLCGVVLLPVLLYSHRLQEIFFAIIYRVCQCVWDPSIAPVRRALLSRLDGMESRDSSLRSRGAVRVLEVGAAYGANLDFFHRPVEYWKVEPNTAFEATFQKKLAANPKVRCPRSMALSLF